MIIFLVSGELLLEAAWLSLLMFTKEERAVPVSAHPLYSATALLQRAPQKLLGSGTRSSVAPKWGLGSLKAWFLPTLAFQNSFLTE